MKFGQCFCINKQRAYNACMKSDSKIITHKDLFRIRAKADRNRQTLGFTSGCYDLMHLGHVLHFAYCRRHCDVLVVSIGNDQNVRRLKGSGRPILPAQARARMIAALEQIDWVIISQEKGIFDFVRQFAALRPDLFFVPDTDSEIQKKELCIQAVGGKIHRCRRIPPREFRSGISTSAIISRIRTGSAALIKKRRTRGHPGASFKRQSSSN